MRLSLYIKTPQLEDELQFLAMTNQSQKLHHPWVRSPRTSDEFKDYIQRYRQPNQKSYIVCHPDNSFVGVFNLSEIIYGFFQNAYLGFYASVEHVGKGFMSQGLQLVLNEAFTALGLHRIEANIQPDNISSIHLVSKNGFRKEGFSPRYLKVNDEWRDHERWAITLEDWSTQ